MEPKLDRQKLFLGVLFIFSLCLKFFKLQIQTKVEAGRTPEDETKTNVEQSFVERGL
jgi:hypothetical protein